MNAVTQLFDELESFLRFEDFTLLTKRIIDLTLDTGSIEHYKETNAFLDELDTNEKDSEATLKAYRKVIDSLRSTLQSKPIPDKKMLVSTHELKKNYGYTAFGLGPIDMELWEGQIIGLVGENGNGKTTLLRSLCGELQPTSGTITYEFDYDDQYDLRTQLVYIPQRTDTWYGSMYENLQFTAALYGYSPEENPLIVELIIARLGLRKFRKHSWSSLSSGYKMRFELARMLLRKPKILLIDEPLANLDILAQQTILEDFRAIAKSPFRPVGIVLSSQQLYEVEKASDQVIFLKAGKQKNLHEKPDTQGEQTPENQLVIEFESEWSQSKLGDIFASLEMISLQYNGGTYIVTFPEHVTVYRFMEWVISNQIPIQYFRNISKSTRRFFVS